jgi:drug/metabolite transporter (DMT)-like permease
MWSGIACGVAAGALWGMVFIVPVLLPAFSPVELAVGRYIAYGAIALGMAAPQLGRLLRKLDSSDLKAMVRQALTGNIVYYIFLALGVKLAGVPATSLIVGMLPVSVILLGRNDHGAARLRDMALPLLLIGGAVLCMNADVFSASASGGTSAAGKGLGIACAAGALACWTYYALDNARFLKRNQHFTGAEWSMLYGLSSGAIALLIGAVAFVFVGGQITGAAGAASGRDWGHFAVVNLLLALGASVIGNHLWNVASRRVPVTLCGTLILSETMFAFLYGFIYQGRMPRMLEALAMVLMVGGTIWSVRAHDTSPPAVVNP